MSLVRELLRILGAVIGLALFCSQTMAQGSIQVETTLYNTSTYATDEYLDVGAEWSDGVSGHNQLVITYRLKRNGKVISTIVLPPITGSGEPWIGTTVNRLHFTGPAGPIAPLPGDELEVDYHFSNGGAGGSHEGDSLTLPAPPE
jgi:hypothetical protein